MWPAKKTLDRRPGPRTSPAIRARQSSRCRGSAHASGGSSGRRRHDTGAGRQGASSVEPTRKRPRRAPGPHTVGGGETASRRSERGTLQENDRRRVHRGDPAERLQQERAAPDGLTPQRMLPEQTAFSAASEATRARIGAARGRKARFETNPLAQLHEDGMPSPPRARGRRPRERSEGQSAAEAARDKRLP